MGLDLAAPVHRTRSYDYAVAPFDAAAAMRLSGLDYMRALVAGEIGAEPPMIATMGMTRPLDLAEGRAAVEAEPAEFLLNPLGAVHGGFAATILDSVLGIAVHTALPAGVGYTTADLKVTFTRAILPSTGRVRAEGTVVHLGRRMATAEARLVALKDGRLLAHGAATCFLFPLDAREG